MVSVSLEVAHAGRGYRNRSPRPPPLAAVDRPNLMIKVPGTGGAGRPSSGCCRGHQHQHHPALFAGALPRGGRPCGREARLVLEAVDRLRWLRSSSIGGYETDPPRGRGSAARPPGKVATPPSWRTPGFTICRPAPLAASASAGPGQRLWPAPAPGPAYPTCSTWTRSSAPTPSTRCLPRPPAAETTARCADPAEDASRRARSWIDWRRGGGFRDVTRAGGRRDREVRQVVRDAAGLIKKRRHWSQAPRARRSRLRGRGRCPARLQRRSASQAHLGRDPTVWKDDPGTRDSGSARLAHGGRGDGAAGEGSQGLC
jgi:hypothetical protein